MAQKIGPREAALREAREQANKRRSVTAPKAKRAPKPTAPKAKKT